MSSDIALRLPGGPDPAKVAMIRNMCAPSATDTEFQFYLEQCARLGLDPLLKQIYFQKRGGKVSIELGIDGYRAVADATGEYAGCDEPVYTGHGTLGSNQKNYPKLCSVTVYRMVQGQRCGFTGQAAWQDFYNPGNAQWDKMPYRMLSIRAETTALKKAFPRQLQGTYTPDEMDDAEGKAVQAEIVPETVPVPPAAPVENAKALEQQVRAELGKMGVTDPKAQAQAMVTLYGKKPERWSAEVYHTILWVPSAQWRAVADRYAAAAVMDRLVASGKGHEHEPT